MRILRSKYRRDVGWILKCVLVGLGVGGSSATALGQLVEEVRFLKRLMTEQTQEKPSLVLDRHEYSSSDVDAQGIVTIPPTAAPLAQLTVDLSLSQGMKVIARQSLGTPREHMTAFLLPLKTLAEGDYVLAATIGGAGQPSRTEWRFRVTSGKRATAPVQQGRVRLTLPSRDFAQDASWPARTGVPFPKGVLMDASNVRLLEDGKEVPCQVEVRARWSPRGSVRWLGLTFVAQHQGGKGLTYELEYGVTLKPTAKAAQPVTLVQDNDTITVNTGPLKFVVRKKAYDGIHASWLDANGDGQFTGAEQVIAADATSAPYIIDQGGTVYRSSGDSTVNIEVEVAGPVHSVIRVEGWFQASTGARLCKYITYYEAFAGQPLVFVNNAVIMTHDTKKNALKDVGFPVAVRGDEVAIGLDGRAVNGRRGAPTHVTQESWNKAAAKSSSGEVRGVKMDGWADAGTPTLGVTLAAQYAWQRFPKEFSATGGRLVFHSWPADLGDTFKDEEELKDNRDYMFLSAHEGPAMNLNLPAKYVDKFKKTVPKTDTEVWRILANPDGVNGQGVALNDLFVLRFRSQALNARDATSLVKLVEKDPHAAVDPNWIGRSRVFGPMVGVDRENYPELERYMSRLMLSMVSWHLKDNDEYGGWNFGDVHSTWDWNKKQAGSLHRVWLNSHYGQTDAIWELYGHYGNPDLLDWARVNHHHAANVDMVNYADPERPITNVFDEKGKLFHRTGAIYHCKGLLHWGGDAAFSRHYCYASGLLYSWFMTGNRRSRDVARLYHEGAINDSAPGTKGRDGQTFLGEAVEYYQNWWDPRMLELIKRQIDVLVTEPPSKQHALYWNVASFPRYYDLTRDAKMLQWLVDDPEFRSRNESHFISAYLFLVTGDRKYFSEIRNLYADLRNQYENRQSTYDGMDDMRWVDRISQLRQYLVIEAALQQEGRRIERPSGPGDYRIYTGSHVRVMGDKGISTLGAMKPRGQPLLLGVAPEHQDKVKVAGPDGKNVALVKATVNGQPGLAVSSDAAAGLYTITVPATLLKLPLVANAEEFFYLKKGQAYTLCADGARAGGQLSVGGQFNISPLEAGAPLTLKTRVPKFPGWFELYGPDGKTLYGKASGFGETDDIVFPNAGGPYTLLATRISSVTPDRDAKAVPVGKR